MYDIWCGFVGMMALAMTAQAATDVRRFSWGQLLHTQGYGGLDWSNFHTWVAEACYLRSWTTVTQMEWYSNRCCLQCEGTDAVASDGCSQFNSAYLEQARWMDRLSIRWAGMDRGNMVYTRP